MCYWYQLAESVTGSNEVWYNNLVFKRGTAKEAVTVVNKNSRFLLLLSLFSLPFIFFFAKRDKEENCTQEGALQFFDTYILVT